MFHDERVSLRGLCVRPPVRAPASRSQITARPPPLCRPNGRMAPNGGLYITPGSVVGWPRSSPRLMACPIDPPFVHNVWSLDFKYARYAKKLGDCAGTYGSAALRWVSSGSVNSEPKPVRLGPGADHRLPPIVVYNNINLKWNLGPFCQKCVWRRPIDPSNINGLCHIPPLKV
jgi:hypothetical protein